VTGVVEAVISLLLLVGARSVIFYMR